MTEVRAADRRIGMWSSWGVAGIGVAYVVTGAVGLVFAGRQSENFGVVDPALAILEVLIILAVPPMVVMMAAVHSFAPPGRKAYSRAALEFMVLLGGVTSAIHFVELTVVRRIDLGSVPGLTELLSFQWPSVAFALDLLAWDVFLGLSMLLAASVFERRGRQRWVRVSMITSGALCLIGTLGPASGDLRFQMIAIVGYAFVFPLVGHECQRFLVTSRAPHFGQVQTGFSALRPATLVVYSACGN